MRELQNSMLTLELKNIWGGFKALKFTFKQWIPWYKKTWVIIMSIGVILSIIVALTTIFRNRTNG